MSRQCLPDTGDFQDRSVLVIGLGGLGSPLLMALTAAAPGLRYVLADDDCVEVSNLHRQLLYDETDVGFDKLEVAARALVRLGVARESLTLTHSRFLPENARALAREVDLLLEGADNYPTKFLACDAAFLENKPIVHGAAIRWTASAWAVGGAGGPCYRCLFEDVPPAAATCAEAGVMGPVVGVAGGLMADLAVDLLMGETGRLGTIHTYDGKTDRLRAVQVSRRASCALCGERPSIHEVLDHQYLAPLSAR